MKLNTIFLASSLILSFQGSPAMSTNVKTTQKSIIQAQTHTLPNGLKIIVLPSCNTPIVTVGMLVNVGTADDPVDQVGLSHFLEHMMFKGTRSVPNNLFKKKILQVGGETNALTEYDYTLYYTTVSKKHMKTILKMEADRLRNLSFSEEEVSSEKKVVLEERGMRIENNPMGTVYERYLQAFNPYHPYGTLPIGFPHHIQKYSYSSARSHYNTWYHPNNTYIIITGNATLTEVLPIVEKYFSKQESKELPKRTRIQNPPRDGVTQTIVQYNKRNSLIMTLISYDAPHFHQLKDKKTYYALNLLSQIIAGNDMTDIAQEIVEKKKHAIALSTDYDGDSIDQKDFTITAILSPDMNLNALQADLKEKISVLIKDGVNEDQLNRAKNDKLAPLDSLKDGTNKYLFTVSQFIGKGRSIEDLNAYVDGIKNVTLQDIKEVATLVFSKDPIVTVEIYPEKK